MQNAAKIYMLLKNSEQSGPHSEADIRTMLSDGIINDSDLVWKEGMEEWSTIKSIPSLAKIKYSNTTSKIKSNEVKEKKPVLNFREKIGTSGKIAACQTKLEKLKRIDLLSARKQLGEEAFVILFDSASYGEYYTEVANIDKQIEELRKKIPLSETASAADKAKSYAKRGKQAVKIETLYNKRKSLICQIGQNVENEQTGAPSILTLIQKIDAIKYKINNTEKEIAELRARVSGLFARPGKVLIAGIFIVLFYWCFAEFQGYRNKNKSFESTGEQIGSKKVSIQEEEQNLQNHEKSYMASDADEEKYKVKEKSIYENLSDFEPDKELTKKLISEFSAKERKWGFDYVLPESRPKLTLPRYANGNTPDIATINLEELYELELPEPDAFDEHAIKEIQKLWQIELAWREYVAKNLFTDDFFQCLAKSPLNDKIIDYYRAEVELRGIGVEGEKRFSITRSLIAKNDYLALIEHLDGKKYKCFPPVREIISIAESLSNTEILIKFNFDVKKIINEIEKENVKTTSNYYGIQIKSVNGSENILPETVFPFPIRAWTIPTKNWAFLMNDSFMLDKEDSRSVYKSILHSPKWIHFPIAPSSYFEYEESDSSNNTTANNTAQIQWTVASDLSCIYTKWSPDDGKLILTLHPHHANRIHNLRIFINLIDKFVNISKFSNDEKFFLDYSNTGPYHLDGIYANLAGVYLSQKDKYYLNPTDEYEHPSLLNHYRPSNQSLFDKANNPNLYEEKEFWDLYEKMKSDIELGKLTTYQASLKIVEFNSNKLIEKKKLTESILNEKYLRPFLIEQSMISKDIIPIKKVQSNFHSPFTPR
jgi:hypothetical protein